MSYIYNLECPKCNKTYSIEKPVNLCECGTPLLVNYDLEKAKREFSKEMLPDRPCNMWRYKELLPVKDEENIVTLGEGLTPLLREKNLGNKLGLNNLFLKDDGIIPTGTFKARGAAAGVSKAKELGIKEMCMPTAGNAGGAWSLYSAKANITIHIGMPKDAPDITQKECKMAGADVFLVDGLISDAGKIIAERAKKHGWFEVATLKEPYRIEGKKTMGYEIVEQLNWEVPDVILYPTGGGVGIIGIWKALKELEYIGFISGKKPKMVAVQSEGCAPIVKAYEEGKATAEFWSNAETIAGGIRVPKALGDFLILKAIYESGGTAVAVSDKEILEAMKQVSQTEGQLICPEGAANIAALKNLIKQNYIARDDKVVLLNTGSGLKYGNLMEADLPVVEI